MIFKIRDKLLKRTLNEKIPNQTKCSVGYIMAEAEGFEPPWACTQTVFKTASL